MSISTGLPKKYPFQINTFNEGQQRNPKVVSHGDKVFYVWESVGQDLGGWGVVGSQYPNGREFVVNSQRNLNQYDPTVEADAQGRVIVAWANTIRSDYSIISAQEFTLAESSLGPLLVQAGGGVSASDIQNNPGLLAPPSFTTTKPTQRVPVPAENVTVGQPQQSTPDAPRFPQPVTVADVPPNELSETQRRSGVNTPGTQNNSPVPKKSSGRFLPNLTSVDRFPVRRGVPVRSGIQTTSQAAVSAMNRMAGARSASVISSRSSVQERAGSSHLTARSGAQTRSAGGFAVSRAQLLSRSVMSAGSASAPSRAGIRNTPARPQPRQASRNAAGVGLIGRQTIPPSRAESIARNTPVAGAAKDRFEMIRMRAQQATSTTQTPVGTEVPAGLKKEGAGYSLQWSSQSGARYQVQGSSDRSQWKNEGGVRSGRDGLSSASINGSYKYYRVIRAN